MDINNLFNGTLAVLQGGKFGAGFMGHASRNLGENLVLVCQIIVRVYSNNCGDRVLG